MLLVSVNDTEVCPSRKREAKEPCYLELPSNLILFISVPASARQETREVVDSHENGLGLKGFQIVNFDGPACAKACRKFQFPV